MNVWNHTNGCDCDKRLGGGVATTATFPGAYGYASGALSPRELASLPEVGDWPQEVDRAGFEQALPPGRVYRLKQNGVDVGDVTVGEHRRSYVHVRFPGSDSDSTGPMISATDRFVVDERGNVYVVGEDGGADFEFHPARAPSADQGSVGVPRPDLDRLPEVGYGAQTVPRERLSEVLPVGRRYRQRTVYRGQAEDAMSSHVVTVREVRDSRISVDYEGGSSGGPMLGSRDSFVSDSWGRVYLMDDAGEPYLMYDPY